MAEIFNFVELWFFLLWVMFLVKSDIKLWASLRSWRYIPPPPPAPPSLSFPKNCIVLHFRLKSWSILSWFLYNIWNSSQDSLFCLWISTCCHIICWKGCPSFTELFLHLCQKSVYNVCVNLFLKSLLSSLDVCAYPSLCQYCTVSTGKW